MAKPLLRTPPRRPGFTPHVAFDTTGLLAGDAIGLNGHRFVVSRFEMIASALVSPRPDGSDVLRDVTRVDLDLAHADWSGCPRVDPDEPAKPAGAMPWSVWVDAWGGWWVFHEATGKFFPVVRDIAEGRDLDSPHISTAQLAGSGE